MQQVLMGFLSTPAGVIAGTVGAIALGALGMIGGGQVAAAFTWVGLFAGASAALYVMGGSARLSEKFEGGGSFSGFVIGALTLPSLNFFGSLATGDGRLITGALVFFAGAVAGIASGQHSVD